jgi:hypothetical protein
MGGTCSMHANISPPPSNAYEVSVGNLQWNTTPERHMSRWEDIIFYENHSKMWSEVY